jgi:cytochrome c553
MARDQGPFRLANPWPRIGWLTLAVILVLAGVLGFLVVNRYQPSGETLSLWSGICRGLGITADIGPASEPQPALRTPSRIAWTGGTIDQIRTGDSEHGSFVALNCAACHGEGGVSTQGMFPTLAGMDAAAIYKQLDDFRSGKRSWGVMNAIAKALSDKDSADVAAYFASLPAALTAAGPGTTPRLEAIGAREDSAVRRLVFVGDPQRGIPPCAACHGPLGYKTGAPPLTGQQAAYIQRQLAAFAQGIRQNDINGQMRTPAKQLKPDEMHLIAAFYGTEVGPKPGIERTGSK